MKNNRSLTASDAASLLGSIKTPRKTAASVLNVRKAQAGRQAKRKALADISCDCGAGSSVNNQDHKGTCPRYHAIRYRESKGLPLA